MKMLKVTFLTFGGGPMSVALYSKEFVNDGYLEQSKLNQFVIMGNVLPGASIIFISGYIGYELRGKVAMLLSILMVSFPIAFLAIFFYYILDSYGVNFYYINLIVMPVLVIITFDYIEKIIANKMKNKYKVGVIASTIFGVFVIGLDLFSFLIIFIIIILIIDKIWGVDYE